MARYGIHGGGGMPDGTDPLHHQCLEMAPDQHFQTDRYNVLLLTDLKIRLLIMVEVITTLTEGYKIYPEPIFQI